jgi:predicted nucleic acid-binding protein
MRVLVDTSVWSLALRRKEENLNPEEKRITAVLADLVREARVDIIGPIRQELLSGVRQPSQFETLKTALRPFNDEPLSTADYEEAARIYNLCRSKGVECGPIDILICAVALNRKRFLFTVDEGLKRCAETLGVKLLLSSRQRKPLSKVHVISD